jgi:hypothetical protein
MTLATDNDIFSSNTMWYGEDIGMTAQWFKFTAESGKQYHVQWRDDNGQPSGSSKTGWVQVTAYKSDGTTPIVTKSDNTTANTWTSGWKSIDDPVFAAPENGTVYLKVEPYVGSSKTYTGTYAIRVYDLSALSPQGPMVVGNAVATASTGVYINLLNYGTPNTAITGYRVYRSDSKNGTFAKVGDDVTSGKVFTDTTVTANKSYWYKVAAYNGKGEGAQGDAEQSDTVGAYSAATQITLGTGPANTNNTTGLTAGNLSSKTDVKWYKFTADNSKVYKLQWGQKGVTQTTGNTYTAYTDVSVFQDNTPIIDERYSTASLNSPIVRKSYGWTDSQVCTLKNLTGDVYVKFEVRMTTAGTFGFKVWEDGTTGGGNTTDPTPSGVKADPSTAAGGSTLTINGITTQSSTYYIAGKKVYIVLYDYASYSDSSTPIAWGAATANTSSSASVNLKTWTSSTSADSAAYTLSASNCKLILLVVDGNGNYTSIADFKRLKTSPQNSTGTTISLSNLISQSSDLTGNPPGMPGF